jgi:purine nucleosidase
LKIHLDTDLGSDIDDLCALLMMLRWPGVEVTAITTSAEEDGKRAGYVRHALELEGRENIPVAAGANSHRGYPYPDETLYWGGRVEPAPGPLDTALRLLKRSIEQGATIVAIGPYTNLHLLERQHPGILKTARLFLMGGYVYPPRAGFPQLRGADDYNVQVDAPSALHVVERSAPTFVPLAVTVETFLRRAHLDTLRASGALGALLARQAEAYAKDECYEEKYGGNCYNLPSDIINFQHDPLACAIALGWSEGVEITSVPLSWKLTGGLLHATVESAAPPARVVTGVDGNRFSQFWLDTIAGAPQS